MPMPTVSHLCYVMLSQINFLLHKSCYSHIRELHYIHPYLDLKTASTIATSIVHSKLDYCKITLLQSP